MNILDIGIIIFIIFGGLVGWKQGFTKSLVNCVGYIVIVVVAFLLKNPLGEFLMMHLPFFDLFGLIKGLSIFNIALYQIIAFFLVFGVLMFILHFLMLATSFFETILKFTVILGIPSKILGALLGLLKNYVIAFVILYIMSLPMISGAEFLNNSKLLKPILEQTPVLSIFANATVGVANEFAEVKDKYEDSDTNEFNLETLDLFLKYDIVGVETVEKLVEKDKLHIDNVDTVLNKYKEGEQNGDN